MQKLIQGLNVMQVTPYFKEMQINSIDKKDETILIQ